MTAVAMETTIATNTQLELHLDEACPEHGHQARHLMPTPTGYWNKDPASLVKRYKDTVYRCDGRNQNGSGCSWMSSSQLGTFVPPGLTPSEYDPPTLYHEKRYRPGKWQRRFANRPVSNPNE